MTVLSSECNQIILSTEYPVDLKRFYGYSMEILFHATNLCSFCDSLNFCEPLEAISFKQWAKPPWMD